MNLHHQLYYCDRQKFLHVYFSLQTNCAELYDNQSISDQRPVAHVPVMKGHSTALKTTHFVLKELTEITEESGSLGIKTWRDTLICHTNGVFEQLGFQKSSLDAKLSFSKYLFELWRKFIHSKIHFQKTEFIKLLIHLHKFVFFRNWISKSWVSFSKHNFLKLN